MEAVEREEHARDVCDHAYLEYSLCRHTVRSSCATMQGVVCTPVPCLGPRHVHCTSRLPVPHLVTLADFLYLAKTYHATNAPTLVHHMPKVILITGCSSGFGQEIALAALAHGDTVVATARDPTKLADLVSRGAITERLDVVDDDAALKKTIDSIVAKTGTIDVLINNVRMATAQGIMRQILTFQCLGRLHSCWRCGRMLSRRNRGAIQYQRFRSAKRAPRCASRNAQGPGRSSREHGFCRRVERLASCGTVLRDEGVRHHPLTISPWRGSSFGHQSHLH